MCIRDRYMYPYYKEDIEKGILTPEKAMELIEMCIRDSLKRI